MPKSYAHAEGALNTMRGSNYTAFTAYVALFTIAPTETGGGTEVAGGGYARVAVTFGAPAGTPRVIANTNDVLIDMPGVTVNGVALMDASSGGNIKYPLTVPSRVFQAGDQAHFPPGSLTVQET